MADTIKNNYEQKKEYTMLSNKFGGGPHGLGDPDDKSLRKVEKEILIPKKMRERAREEKCTSVVEEFKKCGKREGLLIVFNCRKENDAMKACLERWYRDDNFREECTQQYLAERTHYRKTGIPIKRVSRLH